MTDGGQKTSRPPGQPDHSADQESPDPLDAEVTVEQVDDHAKAKKLADNPQPSVTLFDPAPAREAMRTFVSRAVLGSTAVAGIAVVLDSSLGGDNPQLVMGVFTALVGLSGTIMGFYFGGKDQTAK